MIIQTGMRTDIPAFYSEWLINRIREGFVLVRNPYHPQSVTRYSLSPEVVDLITFCTKNPAPLLEKWEALKPYHQYWFVTITPYGPEIEPRVPDKGKVMEELKRLSGLVGTDSVAWRYDPIIVSEEYPVDRHAAEFEEMARALSGYIETCVISFIDLYQKVRRNCPEWKVVSGPDRIRIGKAFAEIGKRYGIRIKSCAEGTDLEPFGIDTTGCMTVAVYEQAIRQQLHVPKRKALRSECACFLGNDIGAYNSCGHLCRYCYANDDREMVIRNMREHDPHSPFLLGWQQPGDQIHEAKQESWVDLQMRLEF